MRDRLRETNPPGAQPWPGPVGLLRLSMVAALVFPFALAGGVAWQTREEALARTEAEARHAVATITEHTLKVLETHGLAIDLADQAAIGLSCDAIRASASLPALLARVSPPVPNLLSGREVNSREVNGREISAVWVIGADGHICGSPSGYHDDGKSRLDRDYFAGARDAGNGGIFVGRPAIGRIAGNPFFSLARRRSAQAGEFTGIIVVSMDMAYLARNWEAMAPSSSGHRIALYRADGVALAPATPEAPPDAVAERRVAARWATAPEGVAIAVSATAPDGVVQAWRLLPDWGVVVTDTLDRAGALQVWRRSVLIHLLLATLGAAALVGFAVAVLRAVRRAEAATRQTESEERQRLRAEAALRLAQQSEQEKQRLNRALRLLSDCNLALVHAENEHSLLFDVCRLVVDAGGYRMAWIGFVEDNAEKSVRPVAHAGIEDGYLETIRVSWDESVDIGRGPVGTAVRSRQTQIVDDYASDPNFAPWRDAAFRRGYKSSIGLPLIVEGQVIGVFSLYAAEPGAFGAGEAALMEEMAGNLALGIETLRARNQIKAARAELERVVAALARTEQAARASEAQYRALAEHSSDAIMRMSIDGIYRYASPSALLLTGYQPEELIGRHWTCNLHPGDHPGVEEVISQLRGGASRVTTVYRLLHKDGSVVWVEAQSSPLFYPMMGAAEEIVTVARDITARRQAEQALAAVTEDLAQQAVTDSLTGLANRRHFDQALEREWRRSGREAQPLALLLLDADCFKLYNDRYGHLMGDQVLRAIADAVVANIRRPGDIAARYGGEEYAVIMPNTSLDGAFQVAEAIRKAVAALQLPHEHGPAGIVTVSIGAASVIAAAGMAMASLIETADEALYMAKLGGRNQTRHAETTAADGMEPA